MSKILTVGAVALGLIAAPAFAQTPAPAPAPAPAAAAPAAAAPAAAAGKLSSKSTLGTLAANPAAKEVLKKHMPQVVEFMDGGGDIPEANLTADTVKLINDDLAKLP
jgi:hypothetical protein